MSMPETCPSCGKATTVLASGRFRQHGPVTDRCDMSGEKSPNALPMPPTAPGTAAAEEAFDGDGESQDEEAPRFNADTGDAPDDAITVRSAGPFGADLVVSPTRDPQYFRSGAFSYGVAALIKRAQEQCVCKDGETTAGCPTHDGHKPPLKRPGDVPLTIGGLGGPRIGTVQMVDDNGTMTAEITEPAAADLVSSQLSAYSIGRSPETARATGETPWAAAVNYAAEDRGYVQPDPFIDDYDYTEDSGYEQPDVAFETSGYEQPGHVSRAVSNPLPMGTLGEQIAATFKEIFYQYTNRTGRSAQQHLGPSEIGTPCDRRLVMQLLGMAHVNPGNDNWASFKGTAIHAALAEMFDWADAGQGRFVTEMSLDFPSILVPHGTSDLLDRTLFCLDDHKVQGIWSQDKLKSKGPSETYRVQLHVYAYGARLRGEKIDNVALISWPMEKPTLDDLYVWTEAYEPQTARAALQRVDDLKQRIDEGHAAGIAPLEMARESAIAEDCRFCPFHMSGAKDLTKGACNGRT